MFASYTKGEDKILVSKVSSFAGNRSINRHNSRSMIPNEPICYNDIVQWQHSQEMLLGMSHLSQMLPGAIPVKDKHRHSATKFEILGEEGEEGELTIGKAFYLRHWESQLFLSADSLILNTFTNVCWLSERDPRGRFALEGISGSGVLNGGEIRVKNISSGQWLHLELSEGKGCLWLSSHPDNFRPYVLNRSHNRGEYLNNHDLLLISGVGSEGCLGVIKRKPVYYFGERWAEATHVEINQDFYSAKNCQVAELQMQAEDGTGYGVGSCIWQVIKVDQNQGGRGYLVMATEEIALKHLQTGLYLTLGDQAYLSQEMVPMKMENVERYLCQWSQAGTIEPIYVKHPVKCNYMEYQLVRIQGNPLLPVLFQSSLSFLSRLTLTLLHPRQLQNYRQQYLTHAKLYTWIYQLYQRRYFSLPDHGFHCFEFTLKFLQLVRVLLRDEQAQALDYGGEIRGHLIEGMLLEVVRFLGLVVIEEGVMERITQQDSKKTREIIEILFMLYQFHPNYTLQIMLAVASIDPNHVAQLLLQQLSRAGEFTQRILLLEAIREVIEHYRRVNFDQQKILDKLKEDHYVQVRNGTLMLTFQRIEYELVELIEKEHMGDELCAYLLEVIAVLVSLSSRQGQSEVGFQLKELWQGKDLMIELLELLQKAGGRGGVTLLYILNEMLADMAHRDINVAGKLTFVVYRGQTLGMDPFLASMLKINEDDSLDWLMESVRIEALVQEVLNPAWQLRYPLAIRLKFLTKVITLFTTLIYTTSYPLSVLHSMESFVLKIGTLFYRYRLTDGCLLDTRKKISAYQQKQSFLLVDGLKLCLDDLVSQLCLFFDAVLTTRRRVVLHPLLHSNTSLPSDLCSGYGELLMNQRLRNQISSLEELEKLYTGTARIEGVVLTHSASLAQCASIIEAVIQDLYVLGVIAESFRVYGGSGPLKQKLVARVQAKVQHIEEALQEARCIESYELVSAAYNLPGHVFDFVLENACEEQLLMEMMEGLLLGMGACCGMGELISNNKKRLMDLLSQQDRRGSARLMLKWLGRQLEASQSLQQSQFAPLMEGVKQLLSTGEPSVLQLLSMLNQMGVQSAQHSNTLYSQLISLQPLQYFLKHCSSPTALVTHQNQLVQQSATTLKTLSLQLSAAVQMCSQNEEFYTHFSSLVPYSTAFHCAFRNHQPQHRVLLTYTAMHLEKNPEKIVEILGKVQEFLVDYPQHVDNLRHYESNLNSSQWQAGRGGMCSIVNEMAQGQADYWYMLLWVPFYHKPEGLLPLLSKIALLVLKHQLSLSLIGTTLRDILKTIKQMLSMAQLKPTAHKRMIEEMKISSRLLNLCLNRSKSPYVFRKSENALIGSNQIEDEQQNQLVNKIIESSMLQDFLVKLLPQRTKQSFSKPPSIDSDIRVSMNRQSQHLIHEASSSHTHHSLIVPQLGPPSPAPEPAPLPINFPSLLGELRSICGHRLNLHHSLRLLLLHYLNTHSSLAPLENSLLQELESARSRSLSFSQDVIEYPFGRKVVVGASQKEIQSHRKARKYGVVVISRLWTLLEEQRLDILRDTVEGVEFEESAVDVSTLEKLLVKIFMSPYVTMQDLTIVSQIGNRLVDLLIMRGVKQKQAPQIEESLAYFNFRIIQLEEKDSLCLRVKCTLMMARIVFGYLGKGSAQLESHLESQVRSFPRLTQLYCERQVFTMISLLQISNTPLKLTRTLVWFQSELENITERLSYSDSMLFSEQFSTLSTIIQCLTLSLEHQHPSSLPIPLLNQLVQLQCKLYPILNSSKTHPAALKYYETLIVQLLGFFHIITYKTGESIWQNNLIEQRTHYLPQSTLELQREVYSYYQQRYDVCLFEVDGRKVAQVYPKGASPCLMWKDQLIDILQTYRDYSERRKILLTFIREVPPDVTNLKHMGLIMIIIKVASILLVLAALLDRFIANDTHPQAGFSIMLTIHLFLLIILLIQRYRTAMQIGMLEMLIGRSQTMCQYFIHNQLPLLVGTVLLLSINIVSVPLPLFCSLLLLQHVFPAGIQQKKLWNNVKQNLPALLVLGLVYGAVVGCFAMLFSAQQTDQTVPLIGLSAKYDLSFLVIEGGLNSNTPKNLLFIFPFTIVYISFVCIVVFAVLKGSSLIQQQQCLICIRQKTAREVEVGIGVDTHIHNQHNIFRFLQALRFIMTRQMLGPAQKQLRALLQKGNESVFG